MPKRKTLCGHLIREESNSLYENVMRDGSPDDLRRLCKEDLFFLLTVACNRRDINKPWLYARVREVEAEPDGFLDLWAREHYKSTIITFGKTIQDILNNASITVGIFSHTKPISKSFLGQIMREFEENEFLKGLFPDVLWANPKRESPKWSIDNGIIVKRDSNPKEATIEAHGLVDGQPTSRHFTLMIYDDVVTLESVTTPEQIEKVNNAWGMSLNLAAEGGAKRYIGTRYRFNDTYKIIMERKAAIPRIYPATENGDIDGASVFMPEQTLRDKRREMGPYIFSAQMLQNPTADRAMGFQESWLRTYSHIDQSVTSGWNIYILVDPAGEKKKENDYTVMLVIALAPDRNYYLLDGFRDRLNLTERASRLFDLVRKWQPLKVVYEKYGLQADNEHIEYEMEIRNYRFNISPIGGQTPKFDRIRRLVPVFEQGRMWLPPRLLFTDYENNLRDLVQEFVNNEYLAFPVALHDDVLDCMARIIDPDLRAEFPDSDLRGDRSFSAYGEVVPLGSKILTAGPDKVQTEYELFE